MKLKKTLLSVALILGCMSGISNAKDLTIGMSIDDLRLERWQKTAQYLVKKPKN